MTRHARRVSSTARPALAVREALSTSQDCRFGFNKADPQISAAEINPVSTWVMPSPKSRADRRVGGQQAGEPPATPIRRL